MKRPLNEESLPAARGLPHRARDVAKVYVGNGGDTRILCVPFDDHPLQRRNLIRRQGGLGELQRRRLQAVVGVAQGRGALAEALADPALVCHHSA